MMRYLLSLTLFFGVHGLATAQPSLIKLPALELHLGQALEIAFAQSARVDNLLVIVSDSLGRTIFLDNKYRFSGSYQHRLDLHQAGKGLYRLRIIKDNEESERNVLVK